MIKRTYTKRARAEQEQATRERILEAILELWKESGPVNTTITSVAARAGVQRLTLYRHFGDEAALVSAAWERFDTDTPPPDPAAWAAIREPAKRTRKALRALYSYYRSHAALLGNVLRDAPAIPVLTEAANARDRYLDGVIATIEAGWVPKARNRPLLEATFRHAVRFSTWRSLSSTGLDDRDCARLFTRNIRTLAGKKG